ncbi:MAG: Ig-like domain repeat protein [Terracidiphilus sp.]
MRGIVCRGLRLELVAGLGIALAMPALAVAAESSQALATQTTLTAETRDQGGHTKANLSVAVIGQDGSPATGAVAINDHGKQFAGVALDAQGQAKVALDLVGGDHLLRAVYVGDSSHQASASQTAAVHALDTTTPDFQVSVTPVAPATFPLTLTPGSAGTITVTVTPSNNAALTAPMFVTLSCSGLPDQSTCAATPENVEILPTTAAPITSTMVIQTQEASSSSLSPARHPGKGSTPIAWAFLLPGALGLGGLAWGSRSRPWLSRLSLVALVGLVTLMGTTACNPRYDYEHHGPPPNPATPAGTYTITVTGQSSNGISALTNSTTFVLTVK